MNVLYELDAEDIDTAVRYWLEQEYSVDNATTTDRSDGWYLAASPEEVSRFWKRRPVRVELKEALPVPSNPVLQCTPSDGLPAYQ